MSTIGDVIAKLAELDPDTPAEFFSEGGITTPTVNELLAWEARRLANEALPGVAMASGRGACFLVLLPHGVRSFDVVDKELDAMYEELRTTETTLGRLRDAALDLPMGPGAIHSSAWEVLGEITP